MEVEWFWLGHNILSVFKREFAVGESKLKKKGATTYELDSKDVPGKNRYRKKEIR